MAAPKGPGKTAPRFVCDVVTYDPANPLPSGFNLLKDSLPVCHDNDIPPALVSPRACDHHYILKTNQTQPIPQHIPVQGTRVSAVCAKCRQHVDVAIKYPDRHMPHRSHLHHLVFSPNLTQQNQPENVFSWKGQHLETLYYHCSYPSCSLVAGVDFLSPVFSKHLVTLLTDESLLNQRLQEALAAEPERLEGLSRTLPINVLANLRTYIENTLHDKQRKPITSSNKRFMTCFGVDGRPCEELLKFLGFIEQVRASVIQELTTLTYVIDVKEDSSSWLPPQPDPSVSIPYVQPEHVFLDNASSELLVLMSQRPQHEREPHAMDIAIKPAGEFLYKLMGAYNYDRLRHVFIESPPGRPPYYEALGAVDDMSNQLVIDAYRRQVVTDRSRGPYYLRCLQTIGLWRGDAGISIAEAVSMEYSEGKYTDNDVLEAYRYFQLDPREAALTDDDILGRFFARVGDSPDDEARTHLFRIGDDLDSEKIKAVSAEHVSTVEQALVFLGVQKETPDDFIISLYTAKVTETPFSEGLARRAVALIAEARDSTVLKHFLDTGELGATEMDAGEAFQLLQIPDRTVDDSAILAAFSVCCAEAPGQVEKYRKALDIIAREKQSAMLSSVLAETPTQSTRAIKDWPVGLDNIGNTCYLNSLLQFYFTIAPFRGMVLDFENYKSELDEKAIQGRRVGSRGISVSEVQRSQRFVRELRSLFQSMISSPNSAVTPGKDLARLTLLSSMGEAAIRRKSLANVARSALGDINGLPVQGPMGPPTQTNDGSVSKAPEVSDADSLSTLISAPTPTSSNQDTQMEGTGSQSPEGKDVEMKDQAEAGIPTPPNEAEPNPPERPPPVPPRPGTQVDDQLILEEVELGAQQDVTEVINNLLFQSQCAIKPTGVDPSGEDSDLVTDLFYGKTKSYITAARGTRSKQELWADIKVDVATGSRDIYSAIDGAFDVQRVHVEGSEAEQYGAISRLPPVLQVQVQRVQFDQVKKTSFKSTHHLKLRETIYLDRYMDAAPGTERAADLDQRRRQKWKWKEELRMLEARRAELVGSEDWHSLPDLLRDTKERLENLQSIGESEEFAHDAVDIDDSVVRNLIELESMTRHEIEDIDRREKELHSFIDTQFADWRSIPYHLYAVFVHRGSVSFGHYYIYMFDFERQLWRKYNDSYVTEVHNTDEIFGSPDDRNPPTPYFVVYIHDKMRARVAQPVCRDVVDVEAEAAAATATATATAPPPPPRPSQVGTATDVEMVESRVSSPGVTVTVTTTEVDSDPTPPHNRLKRKDRDRERERERERDRDRDRDRDSSARSV